MHTKIMNIDRVFRLKAFSEYDKIVYLMMNIHELLIPVDQLHDIIDLIASDESIRIRGTTLVMEKYLWYINGCLYATYIKNCAPFTHLISEEKLIDDVVGIMKELNYGCMKL